MPEVYPRPLFSQRGFDYHPGDHVVFGGPTQISGKTQLALDLLTVKASEALPAYIAVSKPRDRVTSHYARLNEWKLVHEWPPPKGLSEFFGKKYSGYVVWPRFGDLDADDENAYQVLSAMMRDLYSKGAAKKPKAGIVVMDDTRDKEKVIGLKKEMLKYLTMAGAMDLGMWTFVQKGSEMGETARMSYPNATHVFLFKDPTVRGRDYYGDIGGVNPAYLEWVLAQLKPRQALYINRRGPQLCIVDSDSPEGAIRDATR